MLLSLNSVAHLTVALFAPAAANARDSGLEPALSVQAGGTGDFTGKHARVGRREIDRRTTPVNAANRGSRFLSEATSL
jgi:hypothetical protein